MAIGVGIGVASGLGEGVATGVDVAIGSSVVFGTMGEGGCSTCLPQPANNTSREIIRNSRNAFYSLDVLHLWYD